jgi:hypothetical protein
MNTTYKSADEAWEAGNEWVKTSNRHEMLDFLMETATPEFRDTIITEMANYMSERDFIGFFDHLRRNWEIKTPQELDYLMNS